MMMTMIMPMTMPMAIKATIKATVTVIALVAMKVDTRMKEVAGTHIGTPYSPYLQTRSENVGADKMAVMVTRTGRQDDDTVAGRRRTKWY
jgi:hypothetical protein